MQSMTWAAFMNEGGWSMWPILVFGGICVGSAVHFAVRPSRMRLARVGAMWVTVLAAVLHGMLTDLAAVFHTLQDPARFPDAILARTLLIGMKESTRPGSLGGIFLTLGALLVAVGLYRRWEVDNVRR